jgi:hypothetical protein
LIASYLGSFLEDVVGVGTSYTTVHHLLLLRLIDIISRVALIFNGFTVSLDVVGLTIVDEFATFLFTDDVMNIEMYIL